MSIARSLQQCHTPAMKSIHILALASLVAVSLTSCAFQRGHCCSGEKVPLPARTSFTEFQVKGGSSGYKYPVFRTPVNGPPVLVLHELNGLTPPTLQFCQELGQRGWTVYAPALFGGYGGFGQGTFSAIAGGLAISKPRWVENEKGSSGQVVEDVTAIIRWVASQHSGQKIIVMGNCLSGGFPLAYLPMPEVKAGIVCQPAMPMPTAWELFTHSQPEAERQDWGLSPAQMDAAVASIRDGKPLLGFHYLADPLAPFEKFSALHDRLQAVQCADGFRPVLLVHPSSAGSETAKKAAAWCEIHPTCVQSSATKPHNTVTASGSLEDRKAMRALLYGKLEKLRTK